MKAASSVWKEIRLKLQSDFHTGQEFNALSKRCEHSHKTCQMSNFEECFQHLPNLLHRIMAHGTMMAQKKQQPK